MPRHTISTADELFWGNAYGGGTNSKRGVPMSPIVQVDLGVPTTLAANTVVNAQAVAGAGFVTMTGTTVTLSSTYGRALSVVSSNAGDTTQVITIRGRDWLGQRLLMQMTLNGTTTVNPAANKAFKTVDSVHASAAMTGTLSVGQTDKLGMPYRVSGVYDMLRAFMDNTDELATGTLAVADTATPTATTGDVKGTWLPATAANGTRRYRIWYRINGVANVEQAYGKTNYYSAT